MISEVNTLESSGFRPSALATVAATPQSIDNIEGEIARLTWAVLDGSASTADRSQLAELVRTQHSRRIRR